MEYRFWYDNFDTARDPCQLRKPIKEQTCCFFDQSGAKTTANRNLAQARFLARVKVYMFSRTSHPLHAFTLTSGVRFLKDPDINFRAR